MNTSNGSGTKRHPIEVAARRSGLTKDVLRAWERRYGVVTPGRTGNGRRLYSDDDVERLTLLGRATSGGRPISLVAQTDTRELKTLVQEDAAVGSSPPAPPALSSGAGGPHVEMCLDSIRRMDQPGLRRALRRAVIALRPVVFTEHVVAPLMQRVGALWWEKRLDPGQERMASNASREVLSDLIAALQDLSKEAPRLIVATPARQRHELGSMLAAATGSALGWQVTYLGADIPVEDIASATGRIDADALALSIVFPQDDPRLPDDLRRLRGLLPDLPIVVGGRASASYAGVLEEIGAHSVEHLAGFREIMADLGSKLDRPVKRV